MFNIKQTCTTPLKTPLKRKKLSLKPNELKDEEFMSPVKRRPKMVKGEILKLFFKFYYFFF